MRSGPNGVINYKLILYLWMNTECQILVTRISYLWNWDQIGASGFLVTIYSPCTMEGSFLSSVLWACVMKMSWENVVKFACFLFYSKPNKPDEKWPLYSRASPHYYTYTADGTSGPAGPRGPRASACAFWNDFLNKLNGVKGISFIFYLSVVSVLRFARSIWREDFVKFVYCFYRYTRFFNSLDVNTLLVLGFILGGLFSRFF